MVNKQAFFSPASHLQIGKILKKSKDVVPAGEKLTPSLFLFEKPRTLYPVFFIPFIFSQSLQHSVYSFHSQKPMTLSVSPIPLTFVLIRSFETTGIINFQCHLTFYMPCLFHQDTNFLRIEPCILFIHVCHTVQDIIIP